MRQWCFARKISRRTVRRKRRQFVTPNFFRCAMCRVRRLLRWRLCLHLKSSPRPRTMEFSLRSRDSSQPCLANHVQLIIFSQAGLPPLHGRGKGCDSLAEFVGDFLTALQSVLGNFFGFVFPIVQGFAGVVVFTTQFFAHLFSGLGREQQSDQRTRSQSDQQERNCCCGCVSLCSFIFSFTHKSSSSRYEIRFQTSWLKPSHNKFENLD